MAIENLAYLRGYRDGLASLFRTLSSEQMALTDSPQLSEAAAADTELVTWGLQATGVDQTPYSGRGIRVAVLGTGMDLNHPDFQGREIEVQSFIPGETVQSKYGYTTHLIGTACGPQRPLVGPRYGIAWGAKIIVGKVLSDRGSGHDSSILSGIQWALNLQCEVILLYTGADRGPSPVYERIAQRCLESGSLVIAAAGNSARRPESLGQVAMPANCRSIMAVGGLDQNLNVAIFSPRSGTLPGAEIDLVGPAVDVFSAFSVPQRYANASGTSRAAAHAAGIAALFAEATGARGYALWQALVSNARRLPSPAADVGAGLLRAPQ